MDRTTGTVPYPDFFTLFFPAVELPPYEQIGSLQPFSNDLSPPLLPLIRPPQHLNQEPECLKIKRGAPKKLKNRLVSAYKLANTNGTRFKFSFVLQILMAHLHHLFGMKGKSRYQRTKWLRLYTREGVRLVRRIKERAGNNLHYLKIKTFMSVADLKEWLSGDLLREHGVNTSDLAGLRLDILRKFCVLKLIDLKNQFSSDFNVVCGVGCGWQAFKRYLTEFLWEEVGFPVISPEEVRSELNN